ncbi:MAG: hypothetical protein ACREJM_02465, partial [Candidatus Saccharimonadales bacterium]
MDDQLSFRTPRFFGGKLRHTECACYDGRYATKPKSQTMPDSDHPQTSSPSGAAPTLDPQSVEGIFIEALGKDRGQPRGDFLDAAC